VKRPCDWRERERGRDPRHSCIVQAPAGSGKTELLTQRMLGLLARVEQPEEVVAITFTRKAAAEMRHRLVSCLQAAADKPHSDGLPMHQGITRELALEVLRNNAGREWNLLEYPSRLRIRTIDGLCGELARQLPVLSGLGGDHRVAADAESLYRIAATRTLAVIEDDKDELQADVLRILDRYDNQYDTLVDLLTGMLGQREQWLGHLLDAREGGGFQRHELEQSLRQLVEAQLETARRETPDSLLRELPGHFRQALSHAPADTEALKAMLCASGGEDTETLELPTSADDLPHWVTMINRLLVANGKSWRKTVSARDGFPPQAGAPPAEKALRKKHKEEFLAILHRFRDDDSLREQFNIVRSLPRPGYEDEAWESLQSLMRILLRAATEWNVLSAQTGELDFAEIAGRAIESLGAEDSPSDLALRLDYRIQHLLVDEFQDTSNSQIMLLNRLTAGWSVGDGRTLFLVGDPMQSIYRFRKAEVSLFIRAWEGRLFEHLELQKLRLEVNFRSTRPVVNWVNQHFPRVMPDRADAIMDAVSYSRSVVMPDVADHGSVLTRISPRRDDQREAWQVVEIIEQCDEKERVAVLVRSRSHAAEILALLDRLKESRPRLRYQAIDFKPLASNPQIQDLVSLTLALQQAADRLAWLAVLRAPWAGLDLADLDQLTAAGNNDIILDAIAAAAIPGAVQNDKSRHGAKAAPSRLSEQGLLRLGRIGPILLRAVAQCGRRSIRSLVEDTWLRLGGPACVENASELDDAATFFSLLESLESENQAVDRDTLNQRMKNLHAEPDSNASGKVQILTIYGAKGLQFDTVILPGLNRPTAGDKSKLLHWFEMAGQDRIVMSPMRNETDKQNQRHRADLIQFIANIEKKRQSYEDGRLLYVAATRAKHRLYLLASIEPKAKGEIEARKTTLLGQLWPAISAEQIPLIRQADAAQPSRDSEDPATETLPLPQVYRRLDANWRLPDPPPPVRPGMEGDDAGFSPAVDAIEFRWAGEDARLTGNLVHRLLQLIGEEGPAAWQAAGGFTATEKWCRRQLASHGVRGGKAGRIISRVSRAVENCLASQRGRWILHAHEQSRSEYAIAVSRNGRPDLMVLDRTFVDKGIRWIIDYKTSVHAGGELNEFLDNEAKRYREQMRRYARAMALREPLPIRTALYFPLLDRFVEL
jgi:ATP-dependent exoDNAse (exonuclease V) beta subunit